MIGCDGRGSPVRTRAGLGLELAPEQYDVVWWKLPAPGPADATDFWITVRAGAHPLIAYTSWDDQLQCGVIMPKGGLAELAGDDWLDRALVAAPAWLAEHVRDQRDSVTGPIRLNVLVGRAASWTTPGVLVLGDAAHPMSPVRAQGINLALRDVIVAANHLVPAASADPDGIDAACRAVEAEREPEIARAQRLQRREARGQGDARGQLALHPGPPRRPHARPVPVGTAGVAGAPARPAVRLDDGRADRGRARARGRRRAVGRWAHLPDMGSRHRWLLCRPRQPLTKSLQEESPGCRAMMS